MAASSPPRPPRGASASGALPPVPRAPERHARARDALHELATLDESALWGAVQSPEAGAPDTPAPLDLELEQPPPDDGADERAEPLCGEWSPAAWPALFGRLRAERLHGLLLIQARREERRLRFVAGELLHVSSSRPEQGLEALLLQRVLVRARDLERLGAQAEGPALGALLVGAGHLTAEAWRELRIDQARAVLRDIAAWDEGDYLFSPHERARADEDDAPLPTAELLLELARAHDDPDVVRFALGDLDRAARLAPEAWEGGGPRVDAVDRAVLAGVGGGATLREALARVPGDAADAQRSLLGLIAAALVRLD